MIRFVFFGFLLTLCAVQANAKTVRYEFDVVDSVIGFDQLGKLVAPGEDDTISAAERTAFITKHHDLGTVQGQTGAIVLEVMQNFQDSSPSYFSGDLSCVSGFLCSIASIFHPAAKPPVNVFTSDFSFYPFTFHHEWSLDVTQETLRFYDDGDFSEFGILDGIQYSWRSPRANFTLANLSVSVVDPAPNPVPLPATAWFLGLGLATLGLTRRRRAVLRP